MIKIAVHNLWLVFQGVVHCLWPAKGLCESVVRTCIAEGIHINVSEYNPYACGHKICTCVHMAVCLYTGYYKVCMCKSNLYKSNVQHDSYTI